LDSKDPGTTHAENCSCTSEPQKSRGPKKPTDPIARRLKSFRQGDALDIATIPIQSRSTGTFRRFISARIFGTSIRKHECPHGVVLISQTCDIVLSSRFTVQVAPLVYLPEQEAAEARNGKRPRYVHVPNFGEHAFADLSAVATIDKEDLSKVTHKHGVSSDMEIRDFGRRVARRFGRFAFPDDVVPWLKPLEDLVQKKHEKNSAEGEALRQVCQFRVECAAKWSEGAPYGLTLCVILYSDVLPSLSTASGDEFDIPLSAHLKQWLYNDDMTPKASPDRIAREIQKSEVPPEDIHWLWMALAQSWVQKCTPARRDQTPNVMAAVEMIEADVVSEDRYPLSRYRISEELDLDHLSGPSPA
jgi:hypothetical protein